MVSKCAQEYLEAVQESVRHAKSPEQVRLSQAAVYIQAGLFAYYQGFHMLLIVIDTLAIVLDAGCIIVCSADHSRSQWGHLDF